MQEENQKQSFEQTDTQPEKEKLFRDNLKPLRTYQGDVENIINTNKVSVAKVAIAEQKRRIDQGEETYNPNKVNIRNKIFLFLGIFLVLGGVVAVGTIFYIKSNNNPINNLTLQTTPIKYSDTIEIDYSNMDREALIESILKAQTDYNKQINSVLYVNFSQNKTSANIQELLPKIAPFAPQTLVRNLDTNYMFGIYSYSKNEPFIILTTKDYGQAYSGMLKWEESITDDLGPVFSFQKNSFLANIFIDESIQNIDLRALKGENGKSVIVYGFIDKNTIVITTNEDLLANIFSKYISSKLVR